MKAYFRALAAWFTDPTPAQSAAGVTLLALTLYTGYNIPEPYMIGALRWLTYINVWTSVRVLYCGIDRHLPFVFAAAEVCLRGNHDQRIQDAQFGMFKPRPSRTRL